MSFTWENVPGPLPLNHTASNGKLSLVPRTNFCTHPADLSKNRVWTLSLWKLGHVYVWWSVNWIIVDVNYIVSFQQRLLCCHWWWCITQFTLPEQSDWCDNILIRSYDYIPVLPVNMSRPYFSTRPQPQDTCKKLGSGDDTTGCWARAWERGYTMIPA